MEPVHNALLWLLVFALLVGAKRMQRFAIRWLLITVGASVLLCFLVPFVSASDLGLWQDVWRVALGVAAFGVLLAIAKGYLRYRRGLRVVASYTARTTTRKKRIGLAPPTSRGGHRAL